MDVSTGCIPFSLNVLSHFSLWNYTPCLPVSYTHLDVYKRQYVSLHKKWRPRPWGSANTNKFIFVVGPLHKKCRPRRGHDMSKFM